ncbi:MAG: pyrroline-5-carboxylate reductase [Planctomycetia bacterium]|nr:pyrroline-5-carboxylate reductase [Planctomycetia bacterium]
MNKRIGFIGTGQMATALGSGFVRSKILCADQMIGFDINLEATKRFQEATGGNISSTTLELLKTADIVFFAVKPQYMKSVFDEIQTLKLDLSQKLWVSIVAGLPISCFEENLGKEIRMIRVMPNTPCLVGEAASGFAKSTFASAEDSVLIKSLLDTVGLSYEVPEHLLDAITGLSGSGPAYAFMIIEALSDGGVKMGLPRSIALELAAQTLKGSAELFLKTKEHPGSLKDRVTSPAGTTIEGVAVLEAAGLRSALIQAVEAATLRSASLKK